MSAAKQAQRTPGPWKVVRVSDTIIVVMNANGFSVATTTSPSNRDTSRNAADAAFIVRACNSHDDLLAALKRCNRAHEIARAAIAKAEA